MTRGSLMSHLGWLPNQAVKLPVRSVTARAKNAQSALDRPAAYGRCCPPCGVSVAWTALVGADGLALVPGDPIGVGAGGGVARACMMVCGRGGSMSASRRFSTPVSLSVSGDRSAMAACLRKPAAVEELPVDRDVSGTFADKMPRASGSWNGILDYAADSPDFLHGGREIPVAADKDGRVVEIAVRQRNHVSGDLDVHAFFVPHAASLGHPPRPHDQVLLLPEASEEPLLVCVHIGSHLLGNGGDVEGRSDDASSGSQLGGELEGGVSSPAEDGLECSVDIRSVDEHRDANRHGSETGPASREGRGVLTHRRGWPGHVGG